MVIGNRRGFAQSAYLIILCLFLPLCGVHAQSETFQRGDDPDFNLSSTPINLKIAQGAAGTTAQGTVRAHVDPINGFTDTVRLTASGLPPGITVRFEPSPVVQGGSGLRTVVVRVKSTVRPGYYPFWVTGTTRDFGQDTPINLTIAQAPHAAPFTLSSTVIGMSLFPRSSDTAEIRVTSKAGFHGRVSFGLRDDPNAPILGKASEAAKVTAAFHATDRPGVRALTLHAGSAAPEDTYHLLITGTAQGKRQTLPFTLFVDAALNAAQPVPITSHGSVPGKAPFPLAATVHDMAALHFPTESSLLAASHDQALMRAAQAGDAARLKILLAEGTDVNAHQQNGWTALMWAVGNQHARAVKILLAAGADVQRETTRYDKNNAFSVAVGTGNIALCRLLLEHGAQVNWHDEAGNTALMDTTGNGNLSPAQIYRLTRFLLEHGADATAHDDIGHTALTFARPQPGEPARLTDTVKLLQRYGAR